MELAWLIKKLDEPSKHIDGEIILHNPTGRWKIHLVRGQVLYVSGGIHPIRRWDRAVKQHCSNWNWAVEFSQLSNKQDWECQLLSRGISQNRLSLVRAKLLIRSITQESLFELSSHTDIESDWKLSENGTWASCRSSALSPWEMQAIFGRAVRMRQEWQESGLADFSPNVAPVLQPGASAQPLPVPNQYLNGHFTLWDIAFHLEKSMVGIALSLRPWLEKHILQLQSVPDLPFPSTARSNTATASTSSEGELSPQHQPVIACIDDSPVLAHTLKKILEPAGYKTLSIQEPMRGFTQLIEHKPDLILLDLLLPNADGYSICKFLRDTPVFKKTPIIILTGQSTSIDRARAMLAGATEFLSKPPHPDELLQMIQKYLGKAAV